MNRPFTGGCACGAVRFSISAEPIAMLDCQCRQCQHVSGTGHTSNLTFMSQDVQKTGEAAVYQTRGDGGTLKDNAFCSRCGSPLYLTFADMPQYFVVRAGALDEPARYAPQCVTWAEAGHSWDAQRDGMTMHGRMPPQG